LGDPICGPHQGQQDTKDGQTRFNYENNYSARLKRCFFLEIAVSYDKETSSHSKNIVQLQDCATVRSQREQGVGTFVSGRRDPRYGAPLRGELGLSTVKRIVDLHGGRITVQTEGLPTGAIFRMTLPAIGQRETVTAPVE
jgi:hypothetical protein